jgi:hypothetical protein
MSAVPVPATPAAIDTVGYGWLRLSIRSFTAIKAEVRIEHQYFTLTYCMEHGRVKYGSHIVLAVRLEGKKDKAVPFV